MMNTFVCKLFDSDSFHVEGAAVVNLNDNNQYNYTLWNISKKLYCIPYHTPLRKRLWICSIFHSWCSMRIELY